MRLPVIDVAASIVQDSAGRVLLAERTPDQLSAGYWELPGGKIDPGETAPQAAARELDEEIGIQPTSLRPWIGYEHAFRTKRVRLKFFRVDRWSGAPYGREGQRLAWVDPAAPSVGPLLPSNERALLALGLPAIVAVTHAGAERDLGLELTARALAKGVRLILVCEKLMAPDQRVAFARRIATLASPHGARVLLAGSALEARRAGVDGVLSTAQEVRRLTARPPVRLWATACHGAMDLARATALGADLALVSPLRAADDDTLPIGWSWLRSLAADAEIPIYAQGGLAPAMLAEAQCAGASGIAISLADAAHMPRLWEQS
jgi:8-oxo-dGTP diphosphatase